LSSCDYRLINNYTDHVGLIAKPLFGDEEGFEPCFEEKIFPYYYRRSPAAYKYGKDALRKYVFARYSDKGVVNQSGYITIRFIINCTGEAGRYEMLQTGMDFKKKKFNPLISDQLLEICKSLGEWKPIEFYGDRYDSFYYLSFKIVNGRLEEILP